MIALINRRGGMCCWCQTKLLKYSSFNDVIKIISRIIYFINLSLHSLWYSGKMQQIYREQPCRSVISKKLRCNFVEVTLRHVHSLVNLLHISRTLSITTPLEDCVWKSFQWIVKLLSLCFFIQTEVCLGPRGIPINTLQFTKCELHSKFYEAFFPNHSSLFSLIYSCFI